MQESTGIESAIPAHQCPMCRARLGKIGRLIAYRDDAGQHFAFALCAGCLVRLSRLPRKVGHKLQHAAIGLVARNPGRYMVRFFDSATAAHLYIALEAEHLSGNFSVVE